MKHIFNPKNKDFSSILVFTLIDATLFQISTKSSGGSVVFTSMNQDGDFFIGNRKVNSSTGKDELFDAPIPTVPCLGAFIAPDLLGGGKKLLLGSLIQFQFSYARNWPFGAAMAMFLLALVILVLIFNARLNRKHREYANQK